MATLYTRSTDGSDADDGTTWALAKATLTGVAAIDTAGDRLWVSDAHAETTAGAITLAFAGTLAAPVQVLCGDDVAEPPTALATTATVTSSANNGGLTVTGSVYMYGIQLTPGPTGGNSSLVLNSTSVHKQKYDNCNLQIRSTTATVIQMGSDSAVGGETELVDCTINIDGIGTHRIIPYQKLRIRGGSLVSVTTKPTSLFNFSSNRPVDTIVEGFNFVNLGNNNLVLGGAMLGSGKIIFKNCKLPASWSGSLLSTALTVPGLRAEMYNCDATDTNYRLWIEEYVGSIKHETTIVLTGGASDGTTALAWKMVTTATGEFPIHVLRSPEIVQWNETVGSAITVTVEIVHDSQGSGASSAFTDKEIWIEVQYLGTSGFPLSLFIDDAAADILATAADQTSSSVTWTTTGLTTPVKQKLSVTFTPQEKGFIHAVVCMAGASDTAYIDPKLTVA